MSSLSKSSRQLFRAPWVIPITSPVLRDGAVVVDGERIVAVGPYSELSSCFPELAQTQCPGILLPALVNCHIHLDLSIYGTVPLDQEDPSMCAWISALLKKRHESGCSQEEIRSAAAAVARDQYASGVGLILDIGNMDLGGLDGGGVEIKSLFEVFGPCKEVQQATIESIQAFPHEMAVTGHSPYSTSPELLSYVKNRCNEQGEIFSLHLAENLDEFLLLQRGEGCFPQFLKQRGRWDGTFPIPEFDNSGVAGYLQRLGVLDGKTICVHCVHLSAREMAILKETGASVCLCPGSNTFLGVGRVPLGQLLEHGLLPALGTDSIASNPVLDMWREMSLLREDHPAVTPGSVLAMATLGGAKAMHRESDYGSLEEGRAFRILHVEGSNYGDVDDPEKLLDILTSSGRPESINWLSDEG